MFASGDRHSCGLHLSHSDRISSRDPLWACIQIARHYSPNEWQRYLHGHEKGCETKRFAAPLWLFQSSGPQAQNSRLEEDAKLVVLPLELVCYAQSRGFANERSLPAVDELPRRKQLNSIVLDRLSSCWAPFEYSRMLTPKMIARCGE